MSCAKAGTISYNETDTITSVADACAKCSVIRWESSTDNINWTIIPNESLQTLSVTPTNTLTYYRRGIVKAKESCKECKWRYSNVVNVVIEIPDYELTSTRNTIISGVTVVNKVIHVSELNNVLASNPFGIISQVNSRATLNWNPTETT